MSILYTISVTSNSQQFKVMNHFTLISHYHTTEAFILKPLNKAVFI